MVEQKRDCREKRKGAERLDHRGAFRTNCEAFLNGKRKRIDGVEIQ
jgi:hypothetical protein